MNDLDFRVVGMTDQIECFVASKYDRLRINEYMIVEDIKQGDILCQVTETHSVNEFMESNTADSYITKEQILKLQAVGYNISEGIKYIYKFRVMDDPAFAIEAGSTVRKPKFDEIKHLFYSGTIDKSLEIGIIKNTEEIYKSCPVEYKNLLKIMDSNQKVHDQEELVYLFNYYNMIEYPHIGIFGGSGSGKSYGLRVVIEELMKKSVPTIVFDPHNQMVFKDRTLENYGVDFSDKFEVLKVGEDLGINFPDLNRYELISLIETQGELTESMKSAYEAILDKDSITQSSANAFLDYLTTISKALSDKEEDTTGYYERFSQLVNVDSLQAVIRRFNRLLNTDIFLNTSQKLFEALKDGETVIIQGTQKMLNLYASYAVNSCYRKRRRYVDAMTNEYFPIICMVFDEAHNFCGSDQISVTRRIIKEIAQEGRKYGVFLILASQRMAAIEQTTIAQLSTKFIFRISTEKDLEVIRKETDLSSEEIRRLPYLSNGDVFISQAQIGKTLFARIRLAHTTQPKFKNPFDEMYRMLQINVQKKNQSDMELFNMLKEDNVFPITLDLFRICKIIEERHNIKMSVNDLENKLNKLSNDGYITKKKSIMGESYYLREE
ncbi:MAG: ATP-binding protein [Finegoldia magna]|uniref:ATP-binding protein n=1 Tax=Finegoldia magna TaxID=1260 RepID=UPI0039A14EE1